MERPNILYLHSHDTGRYIQPYGYAVPTPKLQAFAEQGVVFRQAFCNAPTCSPSRACLFTGTWAHVNGMVGLAHRGSRMFDYGMTIPSVLREAGYETVLAGREHVVNETVDAGEGRDPRYAIGYSRVLSCEAGETVDAEIAGQDAGSVSRAVRYLEDWALGPRSQPFFLDCGHTATHRTEKVVLAGHTVQWHNSKGSPAGDPRFVRPPAPIPDTPQTRQDFADYGEAASRLDALHGAVLGALHRLGLAERTLVIVTTDHGIAFPLMKCSLTDHGLGVLFMIRGPGGFAGGKVVDSMVQHLDVMPTVCEAAGIPAPAWSRGASLFPLVDGRADPADPEALHREIFAEVNYHAAYEPMRAIRTARHKFIRRWNVLSHPVFPNIDASLSKEVFAAAGGWARPQDAESLYDLLFDPNEAANLAGDSAQDGIRVDLATRLEAWMSRSADPLLRNGGKMPHWPGSLTDDPLTGKHPSGSGQPLSKLHPDLAALGPIRQPPP
jgi:arylsulfatase A-like enzyme